MIGSYALIALIVFVGGALYWICSTDTEIQKQYSFPELIGVAVFWPVVFPILGAIGVKQLLGRLTR